MRSVRLVTAFSVVATLSAGAVADAAPKPICNLVADPAGDVVIRPPAGPAVPYADSAVDIRSADVVSDAEGLGVTIRVAGLGGPSTSATHTDLGTYQTVFRALLTIESGGREVILNAMGPADNAVGAAFGTAGALSWRYDVGHYANDEFYKYEDESFHYLGPARGAVNLAKSEVRMSVSWADLKKYGYTRAKRDRVTRFRVVVQDYWLSNSNADGVLDPGAVRYHGAPYDDATTTKAYPLGARTCTAKVA